MSSPSSEIFPIASRKSPLALAQAKLVSQWLAQVSERPIKSSEKHFPVIGLISSGDKNQIGSLADSGGKGLFTKEIEQALLNGEARYAVHSMKDMPAQNPPGLVIAAIPRREDPRDAFICENYSNLQNLPSGAILGTASVRRKAQIHNIRQDLKTELLRGNVSTRLKKCAEGDIAATFLAVAGLNRLGLTKHITQIMSPDEMLPAVGQGALCIQARQDDEEALALAAKITCKETELCVTMERAFLATLDGSCKTAIAGLATIDSDQLYFLGEYFIDGDGEPLKVTKSIDLPRSISHEEHIIIAKAQGTIAAQDILAQMHG